MTPSYYQTWDPISFYQLLPGPIPNTILACIFATWIVASFLAGLGWCYRHTSLLAFFSGVIALGHRYNFGLVYHPHQLYLLSVGIFSISRSGDRWAVQWLKVYCAYTMCLLGAEKLYYGGGLAWAFSDAFYIRLFTTPYRSPLTNWILKQPLFVSQVFAATANFIVELAAPLALLGKYWGLTYVGIWTSFHLMVHLTFGNHIMYFSQVLVYLVFLPWAEIIDWVHTLRKPEQIDLNGRYRNG